MKKLREEDGDIEETQVGPGSKDDVRNEIPEKTRESEIRRRKICGGVHRVW